MKLVDGRPESTEGRLNKEIRVYDFLDSLGVNYQRVDHEAAMTMEACEEIDRTLSDGVESGVAVTWGESASWGMDANDPVAARNFLAEWEECVVRDRNHPSLVTWTPMNEEFWPDDVQYPRVTEDIYTLT